ncbi:MAG TPA: KH domain-containing protein [Candidatus Limadaptatus stercorigallinarum]|uniref:KH domain-containing protein n=1 Tax=Candidatus Limadaptatus stercorigallinarum TaxID=2840845 RepID=A0A9D1HS82_9FIRM|nr:KH domain-containing protein [Christensenellales bacterium]HIU21087.1 KH domain-containing protein [Candidatus Limadaptatus stercorigallinarum]
MLELVEYLIGKLVPEGDYSIEMRENGDEAEIVVIAAKKDIGKIIGKQGKIAKAIRTLVKAASAKSSVRYSVVIEERE